MQGHFCFIKCLIFERLPEVDVSAICWIFDKACSCGPYSLAPMGSDTLRGLVGKLGLEWYFQAVGQVRFLASQGVTGLSGQLSCK